MANSDKNIRITTSKNKTTYPNIVFTGSAAGSSVITLEVLDDNTLSFTSNEGQVFSIDSNLSTGTIWAVSDISGIPLLSASAGGTIGLGVYGGLVAIGQTNPIYKLDLKGSFGLASSNDSLYNFIFSNSAASGSNSLQIRSANSLLLYNSGNTFYTGFKSNAATNITYTLPTTDGSNGQALTTNGSATLSWTTITGGAGGGGTGVQPGGQYEIAYYTATGASVNGSPTFKNDTAAAKVTITHTTASTSTTTGALVISGGVGIGGSLYTSTGSSSSVSGVTLANGNVSATTYNKLTLTAPASSATLTLANGSSLITSGGHSLTFNTTATTSVTLPTTGTLATTSNKLSDFAATTSLELLNTITGETGSGALVFATSPDFTTSVTTPSTTFAVFNTNATTINAFGAATAISLGSATGKATFNSTDNSISSTTGGLVVSGGAGFAKSISIAGYLQLLNGANVTAFVSSGTGNTVYTLPATSPSTGSSVLQSTSAGVMSWVPMVASSSGAGSGTVAVPGAQYQVAAYYFSATGASVSGSTTFTNNTSTGVVNISHSTVSTSTSTGALTVSGGVGIGGSIFSSTSVPSSISGVVLNNGIVTIGTWSGNFITSLYGGTGFNSYTIGDILVASTGTSLAKLPAGATNFVLTSNGTGTVPSWQAVPASAASSVAIIPTALNQSFFVTAVSASSGSGLGLSTIISFVVNPSTGIVSASGIAVTNTTPSTSTTTGALTVTGGVGIGGSLYTSAGSTSSVSGVLLQNGNVSASTYNKLTVSSPASSATLTIADGSSLITSGANSLTLTTTATTNATFPSGTKTLVATDVTSLASLTTASSLNSIGTIATGVWNGTAISSTYGGTGLNNSGQSGILKYTTGTGSLVAAPTGAIVGTTDTQTLTNKTYNSVTITAPASSATLTLANLSSLITSGGHSLTFTTSNTTSLTLPTTGTLATTSNKLSDFAATTSLELFNTITGETGSGALVFATSPDFTTSVTTPSTTFSVFNTTATTINAFGAATAISLGAATGKATFNSTDNSTSSTTGGLVVSGGAGFAKSISIAGYLQLFNGANFTAFVSSASGNIVYTLPATSPATGSSVLQSTSAGVMSWVPMTAGGGPSGTINSSTVNNIAFYSAATTLSGDDYALSGNYFFYNGTNTGLNIAHEDNEFNPTASTKLLTVGTGATNYSTNRKALAVISTNNAWTNGDLLVLGVGALGSDVRFGVDWTGRVQIGTPGTGFTLPSTNGTSGQVLTANTDGKATWTTVAGGGSGIVNSGTAGSVAFYAADGTAVSGTGLIQVITSGTAISVNTNLDLRTQNDIRFFNSGNTFYTALQAANNSANYTLSLPTAPVGAGFSVIVTDNNGQMYFSAPGPGIAFSSATANTPLIRAKRPINLQFSAGFTPLAAGPDNAILRIPESPSDGTTVITYNLRRFQVRVETPSAGTSRLQLERSSTDTGAFTLAASGSSHIGGFGVTISGAGIYLTSVTTFSGSLVTSGNLLRLNWTLLNATHANFMVNLLLEEV